MLDHEKEPPSAALDAYRIAQYVLTHKKRPMPTLKQMQEELMQADTTETIRKRIRDVEAQHMLDMDQMDKSHAEEYLQNAHEMYVCLDEFQYRRKDNGDNIDEESRGNMEKYYAGSRHCIPQEARWEVEMKHLRDAHLALIYPLRRELEEQERREVEERERQKAFPRSIADYYSKSEQVQLRIARFLFVTDEIRKEKMLTEFGWASRQVKPLQEIYNKDVS
ncbi:hypothetical protein H0H87_012911 [Tephrocybe sp. NHM501043]|nr:hypothetical protein H0H87_012911 [Tephrocybe sp. NHM501043]